MFGTNLLNDDLASIVKLNEICNDYGLDTISVGATVGYALECYENGLLTKEQLDGIDLTWGNAEAIVEMTKKIAEREGVGDLLADGIKVAYEKLGGIGKEYAVHVNGEEVPAHDPKLTPGLASTYILDATPGRHTQGGELLAPVELELKDVDPYAYTGAAENHTKLVDIMHVVNAAGLCMFGYLSYPAQCIPDQLSAVTGWEFDLDEVYKTGKRIGTIRHAFNLREGHNPLTRNVPGRLVGEPPLTEGNVKNITVDYKNLNREFLEFYGWDPQTTIPSEESLRELGMEFLIEERKKWEVPAV
jgi:aldehyde:ferredoxin oxidoreductase